MKGRWLVAGALTLAVATAGPLEVVPAEADTALDGSVALHCNSPFGGGTIDSYPAASSGGSVECDTVVLSFAGTDSQGRFFALEGTGSATGPITAQASCGGTGPAISLRVEGTLTLGGLTATRWAAGTEGATATMGFAVDVFAAASPDLPALASLTNAQVTFAGGATASATVIDGLGSGIFQFRSPPSWCSPAPTSIDYGFDVAIGQPDQAPNFSDPTDPDPSPCSEIDPPPGVPVPGLDEACGDSDTDPYYVGTEFEVEPDEPGNGPMPGGVTYWECDYGTWPLEVSLDYSLRATAQISCKGRVVATNVRACVEWRRGTGDWPDLGCVGGNWTDQTTRIEQTGWLDCIDGTTRRYRAKGIFFWRLDDGQEIGPERVKSSSVKINCDE